MQLMVESEMDNRQPAQKASEGAMPRKGGSFAESLAARSGSFAASCSSSSSNVMPFKVGPLSCLPITARASVAVAPGFSPSALLESPVLLSNSQAEPSPTTGSLMLSRSPNGFSLSSSDSSDPQALEKGGTSDISFKLYPAFNGGSGISPRGFSNSGMKSPSSAGNMVFSGDARLGLLCLNASGSDEIHKEHGNHYLQSASEIHKNASPALAIVEKRSEDGYNWRKYGQKHVKGSDHPRSYYKCTHPNCQMKKKLELSQDGKITEIIYSGYHDHPKPQPSRRQAIGAMQAGVDDGEKNEFFVGLNRLDDHFDATGTSSPSCSEEEKEPGKILREDVEDAESDAKRRKRDDHSFDIIGATRPIREQRVIVQTASEVDILDDGYRWRKYGQKVVKGNPNPRSYYKCTNTGCPVRKHVERASHDPRSVITTYEGKHNHDVPTARYSSNENSMIPSPRPSVFKSSYAENCDSTAGETSRIANDRSFNLQKHKSDTLGRLFNQNCNETSAGMLELGMAVISTFRKFEPDSGPNTEKLVRS